jgi:hypothetical protein
MSKTSGAKLVLLESIAGADGPHFANWVDLEMLAFAGGKERTESEFRELLSNETIMVTRILNTWSILSIIEAVLE